MSRNALSNELRAIVGEHYVLIEKEDVIVYEQDGSIFQVMPEIVVLPANVEQVSAVIKAAKRANVPIVPRGSAAKCRTHRAMICAEFSSAQKERWESSRK